MDNEKRIQEQFASLPLSEKISSLFKMEVATISEAVNYVFKDSMKVVEKVGDLIADFGKRVETEFKEASQGKNEPKGPRPTEKKKRGKTPGETHGTGSESGSE